MLRIRSMRVSDFGPFKGEQRIDLPKEDGVVIVYGENMRGKTTLLNAIRYALFGRVLTRGSVEIQLHQLGNWESAADGKYGFHVVLAFEQNGDVYELTRECRVRPGVTKPASNSDYIEESFLTKNSSTMGPQEAVLELSRIMPETVSRFFLFDGELLQQYEELLRSESEMGRQIKEAIERILGVPVLTNARADLGQIHKQAQHQEAKAAQRNQKTQQLGNLHADLLARREAMQQESSRLRQDHHASLGLNDDQVAHMCLIDSFVESEAVGNFLISWIAQYGRAATDQNGYLRGSNVKTVQQVLDAGVMVEVNVRVRMAIAGQEILDAKRAGGMT